MDQVKDGGPVAWMIRSRTGLIRCCLTEEPDDERRALAEIDGDTITPLFAAPVAANVPAGWRMVPEKPTHAMLEALRVATRRDWPSDEVCRVRYAAMLAAAPEAATPAPAPLTDEQIDKTAKRVIPVAAYMGMFEYAAFSKEDADRTVRHFARAIEAAHGIGASTKESNQ